MASSDGVDDADLPTKPLPTGEPVAAHVPISELPTAPLVPPGEALTPAGGLMPPARRSAPRTWVWAIVALVTVAAVAALVTGLTLGDGRAYPALSPSISSLTPSTAAPSSTRGGSNGKGGQPSVPAPQPTSQPTQPTAPPPTTAAPGPTDTPSP